MALRRVALIVLNAPISVQDGAALARAWDKASLRVCADGGANRLRDWDEAYVPDAICGDLDSLRKEVKEHFSSAGVRVLKDSSQDSTDLEKCLAFVSSWHQKERNADPCSVIAFGSFG